MYKKPKNGQPLGFLVRKEWTTTLGNFLSDGKNFQKVLRKKFRIL